MVDPKAVEDREAVVDVGLPGPVMGRTRGAQSAARTSSARRWCSAIATESAIGPTCAPGIRRCRTPAGAVRTSPKRRCCSSRTSCAIASTTRCAARRASSPGDVLTGDAKAGAAYFNGDGGCTQCHSPTAIWRHRPRIDPVTIQQRFLFPVERRRARRATPAPVVTVTVTTRVGETLTGDSVQMDDFTVSLRDASGAYRTVRGRRPRVVEERSVRRARRAAVAITDKASTTSWRISRPEMIRAALSSRCCRRVRRRSDPADATAGRPTTATTPAAASAR
jgi:hypothetical protein